MGARHGFAVFATPDGREHCLREGPGEQAADIQSQPRRKNVDASPESGKICKGLRKLLRISKGGADFVLDFAYDSLRIDRSPSQSFVKQDIAVMEVAVEQSGVSL